jgi:hypothetical protein
MIVMDPVFVPTDCCWTVKEGACCPGSCGVCGGINCSQAAGWTAPRHVALARFYLAARLSLDGHPPLCVVTTTDDKDLYDADPASTSAVMTMMAAQALGSGDDDNDDDDGSTVVCARDKHLTMVVDAASACCVDTAVPYASFGVDAKWRSAS